MFSERYRIIQTISKGRKFGSIFIGVNTATGERVILKAIKKDQTDPTVYLRLVQESKFSFNIPGLPSVIELYDSDSETILVKKYQEGITLDAYWKEIPKKERLEILVIILQKLNTLLKHIHEQGICHLDLKPGNILVSGHGEELNVELIDFGLAFSQEENKERKILFPLGYAAPELVLNHLNIVDRRTDYFALGIIIWQLYTGKLPLVHANPSIFTNLQITHPLPDNDALPKGIYGILLKLSYKHQFKLPPNKIEFSQLQQDLLDGIQGRYESLDDCIGDFNTLRNKKRPFYQRISFRKPRLNPNVKG